ncbi:hypothetical protein VTO42DRAFT_8458 [Malbranchea cinnamomea]
MRSSIACSRCRRSKIKCVNAGVDTTCRACASSNRDCVYPRPAAGAGGAAKRDISAVADGDDRNGDWDSPKRQRSRKSLHAAVSAGKDGVKSNTAVLDSSLLTVKVWESLFDLFQLHFSTILPFLHPTTFLSRIRQLPSLSSSSNVTAQTESQPPKEHSQSPPPQSEISPLILLGILTLTARFHPQLIQHHSPSSTASQSNPLVASEFYAKALRAKLSGVDGSDFTSVDINRVQALLMLALHEWGMCRGQSAWVYVGMAIRMAQALGLGLELEGDSGFAQRPSITNVANAETKHHRDQNSDEVIEQETRRRTFWSCFILDRCVSSGKYRPRMVRVRDMGIQLPSDNAFAFGERVRTSRLSGNSSRRSQGYDSRGPMQIPSLRQSLAYGEDVKMRSNGPPATEPKHWSTSSHRSDGPDSGIDRWEVGAEEGVLGRLIRIFRVWGSITKWSCAGGKRADQYPPWHPDSRFSHLRDLLIEFQDGLSRNLQYSPRNTDTHIMYKNTLAPYSLMHIIYFLSVIVLHRAYLPFMPLRHLEPLGPLDEPSFPPDKYNVPEGFWRDSAREVFKASRQMMELVRICSDRGVLMETPLVGFAIYNAAFMGVYAAHFNNMDQEGYLCSKPNSTDVIPGLGGQGQADVRKAIEILAEMRSRLKMATGWLRTIHRLHSYFLRAKRDYKRISRGLDAPYPDNDIRLSAKGMLPSSSGFNGNSDEYRLLDKTLRDFGVSEDHATEINGVDDEGTTASVNIGEHGNASDTASNAVKSESGNDLDSNPGAGQRRESWVPVNSPGPRLPPPAGQEGADHARHDLGPIPRPIESDRWPNLSAPAPTYPLPSIQPHPQTLPPSSNPVPTLQPSVSPNSYSSLSSSLPPYLSNPSSNKLQPLQSWSSRQHLPSYSQSLPSISAAAQHGGFPMPPLPSSSSLHPHPHQNQHLTPPPRLDYSRPYPLDLSVNNSNPAWMVSLGGDDVIAFIGGDNCEQWSTAAGSTPPQVVGVPSGWLATIWGQYQYAY